MATYRHTEVITRMSASVCFFYLFLASTLFFMPLANSAQAEDDIEQTAQQLTSSPLRISIPDLSAVSPDFRRPFELTSNFLQEFWQIWGIDHNRAVEFYYLSNKAAQLALKQRRIDVIGLSAIDHPNEQNLLSIPYAKYRQKIFRPLARDNKGEVKIAIHSDTQVTLSFLSSQIARHYFKDIDEMLDNSEQFDALYSTKPWILESKLLEKNLFKRFYVSTEDEPQVYFHFSTRKSDRQLMADINDSLRAVNTLQAKLWSEKYLDDVSDISLTLGNYIRNLSAQEKDYVIDNNQVNFPITSDGLPPYVITKNFASLSERGLSIDVANMVTEKTGLIFKSIYIDIEKDDLSSLASRESDVLLLANEYANGSNNLTYSAPYITQRYHVTHRIDSPSYNDFLQLAGKTFAVVTGHYASGIVEQYLDDAVIREYASISAALTAVATGEADIFIGTPLVNGFIIKRFQLANLTSSPLNNYPVNADLSFATLKNNTSLATLLNRSLNSINASEFDDIYARWSKTSFSANDNEQQIFNAYRNMGLVLAAMMLLSLVIFWIYYRQLQVRKAAQIKIEKALKLAEIAREEAEHSAQAKVVFLARMSHEIRTPMNGVLGMAEALAFTKLDKKQNELLDTLKGSARNLLALLNDVLDFSKMDAGKLTLESVPVNIKRLAEGVVSGFRHMHTESDGDSLSGIDLTLELDDKLAFQHYTDPTRITQVLNNLLSNAVKFTTSGKVTMRIELDDSTKVNNDTFDTLHFSVQDTGIGIAPEKQGLLFTPFIQADSDVTRKYGGTGLGLSICQEIVRSMGGEILLKSAEGEGSLFHFYLQFKRAHSQAQQTERRKSSRDVNPPDDKRFDGLRVLVAEDNLVNVLVITSQLERLNINADVAEHGKMALTMHEENPYDIIISDCHMPELDGFELANILTNTPQTKPLWLIAITADALSGSAQKCFAAGFNDYMAKPCPQEEVTNKLNNAYRQLCLMATNSDDTEN